MSITLAQRDSAKVLYIYLRYNIPSVCFYLIKQYDKGAIMSITGGTLQRVLTSYSSYSAQSSGKQSLTETAPSTTEDTMSLSTQSLSGDIGTDSDSTTVELSAQSVSVTESSELGDYDLTNITPDDARILANSLWQNGVISINEMLTVMIVADDQKYPYAPGVEGPADNSTFNLLNGLSKVADGTHERLSAPNHQWTAFDPTETCSSLLDILSSLQEESVKVDYSSINISITA